MWYSCSPTALNFTKKELHLVYFPENSWNSCYFADKYSENVASAYFTYETFDNAYCPLLINAQVNNIHAYKLFQEHLRWLPLARRHSSKQENTGSELTIKMLIWRSDTVLSSLLLSMDRTSSLRDRLYKRNCFTFKSHQKSRPFLYLGW